MSYVTYTVAYTVLFLGVLAAGVALVVTDHPIWALVPFVMLFAFRFKPPTDIGSGDKT